jgi:hypothetical protein
MFLFELDPSYLNGERLEHYSVTLQVKTEVDPWGPRLESV